MKLTFMGGGSTVFARNVIGDCLCVESLRDSVFALYDIDAKRLEESRVILEAMKKEKGGFCLEKEWDKDSEETECRDFEEGKPMTEKEFENNLF